MLSRLQLLASLLICVLAHGTATGQPARVDLSEYRIVSTVSLPAFVNEASSVAYSPESGNLYVVGDAGLGIGEFTRAGTYLGAMSFTGFQDTEGIAFIGGGRFVIAEERLQNLYLLTYTRFGSVARSTLPVVSLGAETGNSGIEGVCLEARTGQYFAVKEKSPQRVMTAAVDFPAGTAAPVDLFSPAGLGVLDLSDIAVLSAVPSLVGTADQDNLLIISQESARVLKVSRGGAVLGTFSLAGISTTAEGITIDERGTIYIVDETPRLFILERACPADFNHDGMRDVPDIFAFLGAWFANLACANFNGLGGVDVTDIFAFLSAWFAGCP